MFADDRATDGDMERRGRSSLPYLVSTVALGASVATVAAPARAAEPAPAPTEIVARERPTTRSFYGWQILASGEVGGVVAAAATVLPDSPLKDVPSTVGFLFGMPVYVLGGPATHWTHGDFTKGLISLAGNFVGPLVGGLAGQSIRCGASDAPGDCGARGFFSGFAVALVTVPLVDALVLGWEDLPDDDVTSVVAGPPSSHVASRAPVRRSPAAPFMVVPTWGVGPRGDVSLGVAGRF